MNTANKNKKIIITTPPLHLAGGVSVFVKGLKDKWGVKEVYFTRGGKSNYIIFKILYTLYNYLNFLVLALLNRKQTYFINTSLNKNAFNRDIVFLWILKILKIKNNVFIHGWEDEYFNKLSYNKLKYLTAANTIFVLSNKNKYAMFDRIKHPRIVVENTFAEDWFVQSNFVDKIYNDSINFLFLSRLEKEKGIKQLIRAFHELQHLNIKLEIVGYGNEEQFILDEINNNQIKNIIFTGKAFQYKKVEAYNRNHIYILPSDTEGLPISLVEAMFAGLAVVITKVGAIPEFFQEPQMGYMLENNSVEEIKHKISIITNNTNLIKVASCYNKTYANQNFKATIVSDRIKNIIFNEFR